MIKLSTIKKNPANPRTIRGEQFERLKRSLQSFPQMMALRPIVTDAEGVVLGGNMRLEALKALGFKEVPDEWVKRADELTEEQKREFVIKDNGQFGEYNWDALANEWSDLPLADWGVDLLEDWLQATGGEDEDTGPSEAQLSRAQEWLEKYDARVGQVWQIGRHRLLIGDCTDAAARESLLRGEMPDLLHTDPPYGISIVSVKAGGAADTPGGSKPFGSTGARVPHTSAGFDSARPRCTEPRGPKSKNQIIQSNSYPVIEGDDKPFEPGWLLDMAPVVILWGANYFADKLPAVSSWICWDKREGITRNTFADCELAWCSKGGPARVFHHLWNGLHKGSQHGERRLHPTEKPIALFEEIGREYATDGLWLDFYAGSGAQMVAAEKSGSRCYAAEIEPLYGATILERMSALGLKPELVK